MSFKYYVYQNLKSKYSPDNPASWLLQHMMENKATFQPFYPPIVYIAQVAATLPVSNEPERGFSTLKIAKSRLRGSLKNDMLNALLAVMINGPAVKDCEPVVKAAVKKWLEAKNRRKLPTNISTVHPQPAEEPELKIQEIC